MFTYKKEGQLPIKSWIPENDYYADSDMVEQTENLAKLPFAFHHIVLCPDGHVGYGMPIGGVMACDRAVIPNAVGVDIGCGMCAIKTDYPAEDIVDKQIKQILGIVRENVPVGFEHNEKDQLWEGFDHAPDIPIIQQQISSARRQLGTLGGGNHFIEIQKGNDGNIWLMIHSGSRNFGYKIAKEYNKKAIALCERWFSDIPNKDLAFLPIETKEAKEYLECMNFALEFAMENRQRIMGYFRVATDEILNCTFSDEINIHHNYATWEHHFNKNVLIHRKGATSARKGQKGIIPGSMGTPSYIVEGLGNPESFTSCSHGAGRKMGRKEASRVLSKEECDNAMKDISFAGWGKGRKGQIDLGEAPQAYKDIDAVITAELDLIKPIVKLQPLGVVKG